MEKLNNFKKSNISKQTKNLPKVKNYKKICKIKTLRKWKNTKTPKKKYRKNTKIKQFEKVTINFNVIGKFGKEIYLISRKKKIIHIKSNLQRIKKLEKYQDEKF